MLKKRFLTVIVLPGVITICNKTFDILHLDLRPILGLYPLGYRVLSTEQDCLSGEDAGLISSNASYSDGEVYSGVELAS